MRLCLPVYHWMEPVINFKGGSIYEKFRAIKSVIASTCISSDVCLPSYTIETLYVIKPTQLSAYAIIYNLKFKKIMPDEYSLLIDIKYR